MLPPAGRVDGTAVCCQCTRGRDGGALSKGTRVRNRIAEDAEDAGGSHSERRRAGETMASEDRDDRDEPSRIMDVLADAFDIAGAKQQMREAECARDGHQWRTPHMPSLPEHEQAWLSANDHIYGRCKKVEYDAILMMLFTLAVTTGGIPQATAHPSAAVLSSMP